MWLGLSFKIIDIEKVTRKRSKYGSIAKWLFFPIFDLAIANVGIFEGDFFHEITYMVPIEPIEIEPIEIFHIRCKYEPLTFVSGAHWKASPSSGAASTVVIVQPPGGKAWKHGCMGRNSWTIKCTIHYIASVASYCVSNLWSHHPRIACAFINP